MSEILLEARTLVRLCAEPRPAAESVKAAIRRASRRLGWSFSRTKDCWYGAARRIDAAEMDALRGAALRRENEATQNEFSVLRKRIDRLERHLDLLDEANTLATADVVSEGAD